MIIKAKYPALYRPYMQDVYQGIGGLGISHNNSSVTNTNTERNISEQHSSDFPN